MSLATGSSYWPAEGVEGAVGAHGEVVAGFDDAERGRGRGRARVAGVALCSPGQAERERGVAGRVPGGGDGGVHAGVEGAGGHAGDPLAARDVEDEAPVARAVGGHAGARLLGGVDGVRGHADDPAAAGHADQERVVALASGLQHAGGGGLVGVQGGGAGAGDARAARDGQVEDALQAAAAQRGRGRLVRVEGGGVAAGDARVRDGLVDADDGLVGVEDELFDPAELVVRVG